MRLVIGHLYPELFNLYGDRGNVRCLEKRLQWRGMEAEVRALSVGDRIDFRGLDIVCWGGCSDREQEMAAAHLGAIRRDFGAYVEDGGVVLAVCAAYQLLGNYYETCRKKIEGLGILDIHTRWEQERLVGNIVLESELSSMPVAGFENHAGRTYIGGGRPLGRVVCGRGNTGRDDYEGLLYKNVVGTYLHGPLLPKNPQICDYLLERALRRKYGRDVLLEALPDEAEHRANQHISSAFD